MSVDFYSKDKQYSTALGYGAFYRLRIAIASRLDPDLGKLYADYSMMLRMPEEFNDLFDTIAEKPELQNVQDIIDFLCMPDCDGKITPRTCRRLTLVIPDDKYYNDFNALLKYCAEHKVAMYWC